MTKIVGAITRIAATNTDPRTARHAGRDARRALPADKKAAGIPPEKPLGDPVVTTLSPAAKDILALRDKSLPAPEIALTTVAASLGLVGYRGGFFKKGK